EFLPAANTPETARIVRVVAGAAPGQLSSDGTAVADGAEGVNAYLRDLNRRHRETPADSVTDLRLTAPHGFVDDVLRGAVGFELLDTPGPNEAGGHDLQEQVLRVIEQAYVVLYLLDYSKLKTEAEDS